MTNDDRGVQARKGRPALSIPGKTSAAAREAFPTEASA